MCSSDLAWDYPTATPPRQELKLIDRDEERLVATLECDFVGDNPYTTPRADAFAIGNLLAASPDLLAACQLARLVLECFKFGVNEDGDYNNDDVFEAIETLSAAIAKATGATCDT